MDLQGFLPCYKVVGCKYLVTTLQTCNYVEVYGFYIRRIGDIHIWVCTPWLRHFIDSHQDPALSRITQQDLITP